ncbi:hypothetical protein HRbin30_02262 [bacterium HR30]|nr:hypothetical protein HRbin30_02262 [bacterium HR30]
MHLGRGRAITRQVKVLEDVERQEDSDALGARGQFHEGVAAVARRHWFDPRRTVLGEVGRRQYASLPGDRTGCGHGKGPAVKPLRAAARQFAQRLR